jgi:hypothetical protein
VVSP